ncbi:MAG: NAD-dependent DNA ligase LigA [Lachnospiraceae bacterium]|nr:NAD-dependent DNA ligase LigA [Lachnospiraceae bacterium]
MSVTESQKKRIQELVTTLNCASEKYYAQDDEIMSNYEYDRLYDELTELEQSTGYILSNSPTVNVGYEAVDELPKERHDKPMLSLGKTKDRFELSGWLDGHEGLLSWKLDGLTVVLTYFDGKLAKAVTRGNGEIGEVITNNARTFINLPHSISYKGELVIRGEAVISYSDFEVINSGITDDTLKYKNPRNLCSGAVRQLDPSITAKRNVRFFAFSLVSAEGVDFHDRHEDEFVFLKDQGFDVVDYMKVTPETIADAVGDYEMRIASYDIPSDGLVLLLNEISYGLSLGMTAKFPRNAIAFKWTDETRDTVLRMIEWSASRTGLINPVAVFDPVELEGTTVSRASVHNVSIVRNLKLGIGDTIRVYKANMIIPQIAENLTCSDNLIIPDICPVCGDRTELKESEGTAYLYCTNPECPAKKLGAFTQFVSRDAMNIDGLSESTLEKFIGAGMIHTFDDLYHIDRFRDRIVNMEGFGVKSYDNLIKSVEISRKTELHRLLYAIGIENVGVATAKIICRYFGYDQSAIVHSTAEELSQIDGIGDVIATSVLDHFGDPRHLDEWNRLIGEVEYDIPTSDIQEQKLKDLSFVVTGSLFHYSNRNELKEVIESLGGKVTGSVTGKTECLINNDASSNSNKNVTARKLGVKVLTEDEFIAQYIDK